MGSWIFQNLSLLMNSGQRYEDLMVGHRDGSNMVHQPGKDSKVVMVNYFGPQSSMTSLLVHLKLEMVQK